MYFIDTNIFLELILNQSQAGPCRELFKKIENGLDCACSHFSIYSICINLERKKMGRQARVFLEYLLSLENLRITNLSVEDDLQILETAKNTGLDFDDSLQYVVSQQAGCEKIITFDTDYEKAGIATLRPSEVL